MPISAVDTITLAFQHTKRQLVQPFRFWQWTRLALVGLLAGEMGSGGSFKFPRTSASRGNLGRPAICWSKASRRSIPRFWAGSSRSLVVAGLVFLIVMMYVSSVMRFILFDSVLAKECHIRDGLEPQARSGMEIFFVAVGLLLAAILASYGRAARNPCCVSLSRWDGSTRLANIVLALILGGIVVFFVVDALRCRAGSGPCADQGFCGAADGAGGHWRDRRLAAAVADDAGGERRLRRIRRHEDCAGDRGRNRHWDRLGDSGADCCDSDGRPGDWLRCSRGRPPG